MPSPWLEIAYVVVSMAIVIGLFSLGVWMVKRSFREATGSDMVTTVNYHSSGSL